MALAGLMWPAVVSLAESDRDAKPVENLRPVPPRIITRTNPKLPLAPSQLRLRTTDKVVNKLPGKLEHLEGEAPITYRFIVEGKQGTRVIHASIYQHGVTEVAIQPFAHAVVPAARPATAIEKGVIARTLRADRSGASNPEQDELREQALKELSAP